MPAFLFFFFLINQFLYFWLCWVFVFVHGPSLVAASGGHSSSRCAGLSLSRPLLFRSTGSRRAGAVIMARGPSCSAACGIFPNQGSNPCALHWQADSQPLRHQGSPPAFILKILLYMLDKLCFLHSEKGTGLLPPLSLSPIEKDDGGRERRWREEMRRSFDLRHLGSRAPDGNNQADSGALPSRLSKYQRAGRTKMVNQKSDQ